MKSALNVVLLFTCMAGISQNKFEFSDSAVSARLSRDVHILASDSFAGRKSGTEGEKKAYQYIISRFREAGLTPAVAGDSSFLQSFPIESVTVPRKSNSMTIRGYKGTTYPQYDFSAVAYSGVGQFEGTQYLLMDIAQYIDPVENMHGKDSISLKTAINKAFQDGYPAVILYNEGLLDRGALRSLYNREKVKPENGLVISVNTEIAAYLKEYPGTAISAVTDIRRTTTTYHNIIGNISNGAPFTVIIGAHYDHLGVNSHGKVYNGADDNGSGTAMLMELARYLKQSGDKANNYLFVAFSGEEEGLYGSGYFVEHPTVDLQTINFMVNLDMVGRLGCEGKKITIFGTGSSPAWKNLYKNAEHPAFRLCLMHGVHDFTDHVGFYRHGIPIISVTTGFHYEYHTTRDDPETLNYPGMADLAKYLKVLLHNASSGKKAGYSKVPANYNLSANLKIILKDIDHIMTVGMDN